MRDFTYIKYRKMLEAAISAGYHLAAYEDFVTGKTTGHPKVFILRHDADRMPGNALRMAQIETNLGVRGTYYFRVLESYEPAVMKAIVALGHELGYHYEDVTIAKGNLDEAYRLFIRHLAMFREFYPVSTICMHGSPMTQWDNRIIWKKFNYREHGIIAEPYFDTDFSKFLYITDTGRGWNHQAVSVRDHVESPFNKRFSSTDDIIRHFEKDQLPSLIMQNIHPHRWNNNYLLWSRELVFQNMKNVIKYFLSQSRGKPDENY